MATIIEASYDELKRLEDENARLRAALEQIVRIAEANGMQDWKMTRIARKALTCQEHSHSIACQVGPNAH